MTTRRLRGTAARLAAASGEAPALRPLDDATREARAQQPLVRLVELARRAHDADADAGIRRLPIARPMKRSRSRSGSRRRLVFTTPFVKYVLRE